MRAPLRAAGAAVLLATALAAATAGPAAAARFTAGQAIAELNAERAANGLPHVITERTDWSTACAHHNAYEKANGGNLTHDENSGSPGYTSDGAWAGQNSVLAEGEPWTATANPWETAPIHLDQLLAPRMAQMGVDETADAYDCATTWPGMTGPPPAAQVVYGFPGPGVTGVPPSEVANESPFTPGDFAGLPSGSTTGPHIYVWADAPDVPDRPTTQVQSASLTGPGGAVDLRWVDQTTGATDPNAPGTSLGPYLTGGILIPAQPLAPATTYAVHVQLQIVDTGEVLTRDWSFTTAGTDPHGVLSFSRGSLRLASRNPATAIVHATLPSHRSITRTLKPGGSLTLPAGRWTACAAQPLSAPWDGFAACVAAGVSGHPSLRLQRGRISGGRVRFRLLADRALAGRRATLRAGSARAITLRLRRSQTVALRVPRGARRVLVRVTTRGFQTRDVTYAAASAARRYA